MRHIFLYQYDDLKCIAKKTIDFNTSGFDSNAIHVVIFSKLYFDYFKNMTEKNPFFF